MPRDKAEEKLLKRLEILGSRLSDLNRERELTLQRLLELDYILRAVLARAQTQRQGSQAIK